jgi:hypothetical protein
MTNEPQIDLSLATAEDMVAELERRACAVALVISHVEGGSYMPSPDMPPPKRQRVIGDRFNSKYPALMAGFLCDGIQWCLSEIDAPETVEMSMRLKAFLNDLEKFLPE